MAPGVKTVAVWAVLLAAAPAFADPAEVEVRALADDPFFAAVVAAAGARPAELILPVPGRNLGASLPARQGPNLEDVDLAPNRETDRMARAFRLGSSPWFYGPAFVLMAYVVIRRRRRKVPPRIVLAWSPLDSPIFDATRPPFDRRV